MKWKHVCRYTWVLPLLVSSIPNAARSEEAGDRKEVKLKPFAESWWEGHPYSDVLGFTAWKSEDTTLKEVTEIPELLNERELVLRVLARVENYAGMSPGELEKRYNEEAAELAKEDRRRYPVYDRVKGFTTYTAEEYEKNRLNARLGIFKGPEGRQWEEGNAVLFSVRESFSFYNYNQEGMSIDYISGDDGDELTLKGAIVSDIYLDALYNRKWLKSGKGLSGDMYRFSIRTGVEFDWDQSLDTPVERTSFYLLANFQANPSQSAHYFSNPDFWQITSPQFLQVGAAFDHDDFSGESDVRWIVNWQPRFYLINDIGPFGRGLAINHIMRYRKGSFMKFFKGGVDDEAKLNPAKVFVEDRSDESPWYSSVPMDIKASGGSDLWDAIAASGGDFGGVNAEWKAGLIVGQSDWRLRFGYLCEGITPLSDIGETTIGHTVFAEVGLGMFSGAAAQRKSEDGGPLELPKGDMGAATLFAQYRFGEHAPSFEDKKEFRVGMRVRF